MFVYSTFNDLFVKKVQNYYWTTDILQYTFTEINNLKSDIRTLTKVVSI